MAYSFAGAPDRLTQALSGTPYPNTIVCRVWVNDITGVQGPCNWANSGVNSAKIGLRKNGSSAEANASISSGGNTAVAAGASLTATTWYSELGLFTSSTSRQAFLDASGGTVSTTARAITSLATFVIGSSTDAAGTGIFSNAMVGRLADVALWSAVLTADEIISLSKGFSPRRIRPQSLVGYWPMVGELINLKGGVLSVSGSPGITAHPRTYN